MTNATWTATDDSIDAWDAIPSSAAAVARTLSDDEWDAAERDAERRSSFLSDLEEDRLRAIGWW